MSGQHVAVGVIRRVPDGIEVVARHDASQLIAAGRLEVPGCRQVPDHALAARQAAVRDLAEDALEETILAALGR
jgi:hypothetical protein